MLKNHFIKRFPTKQPCGLLLLLIFILFLFCVAIGISISLRNLSSASMSSVELFSQKRSTVILTLAIPGFGCSGYVNNVGGITNSIFSLLQNYTSTAVVTKTGSCYNHSLASYEPQSTERIVYGDPNNCIDAKANYINAINNTSTNATINKALAYIQFTNNEYAISCIDTNGTCGLLLLSTMNKIFQSPNTYIQPVFDSINSCMGSNFTPSIASVNVSVPILRVVNITSTDF